MGNRKSLKAFGPKRWLQSFSSSSGKLTMLIALKGHFLTHMPQPLHSFSEMMILFSSKRLAYTRLRNMGQYFMNIWFHFFGFHLS